MERHAQYINWGELARRGGSRLWHRSAGGEQLHCASLFFFLPLLPTFFCYIPFHYYYYYYISLSLLLVLYFTLVIKLFLSHPRVLLFFSFPPPHPTGRGRGKRLRGAELLTGVKPLHPVMYPVTS